jgi:hypothetical protein
MAFLTEVIVAGILYDLIKHGAALTAENLRGRLKGWILGENEAQQIATEVQKLNLNNEMSEKAIQNRISSSEDLLHLLNSIKPSATTITQTHSGTGDNIGGSKIINN